jgi:hypothetical protein
MKTTIRAQIQKLEDQIEELENQIKELENEEMEQWFKTLLDGLELEVKEDRPNSVFYKKNGKIFFEKGSQQFFTCDYDLVWSVLFKEYNLDFDDTEKFLKKMIERYLNLRVKISMERLNME